MAQIDGRNPRPSVTLEEVARVAGVSRATASRVVNRNPRVEPGDPADGGAGDRSPRLRPQSGGAHPGDPADRLGRPLRLRIHARLFDEPFFASLLRGISGELERRLQLVLLMAAGPRRGPCRDYLTGGHVDGVLLVSLHGDDPLPARLAERGIPFVVGGRPRAPAVHFVDVDNVAARRRRAHLIGLGRRVIATIAGPADMDAGVDRLAGYRADSGAGLRPPSLSPSATSDRRRAPPMRALLERRPTSTPSSPPLT